MLGTILKVFHMLIILIMGNSIFSLTTSLVVSMRMRVYSQTVLSWCILT